MIYIKLTKTQKIVALTIPVIILGVLIIRELTKKKEELVDENGGTNPPPRPIGTFAKYKVVTNGGNLNIRQDPSTNNQPIGTLPFGTIIWAKPSSVTGWHEYSLDGTNRNGYVFSTYLEQI